MLGDASEAKWALIKDGALVMSNNSAFRAPVLCSAHPTPATAEDCKIFTDPGSVFMRCGCGFDIVNDQCVADSVSSKTTVFSSAFQCLTTTKTLNDTVRTAFALRLLQCADPREPLADRDLRSTFQTLSAYWPLVALHGATSTNYCNENIDCGGLAREGWPITLVNGSSHPIVSRIAELFWLHKHSELSVEFCRRLLECPCDQFYGPPGDFQSFSDAKKFTCGEYPASYSKTARAEASVYRARVLARCDISFPDAEVPIGTYIMSAQACASSGKTRATASAVDAVSGDIGRIAELILGKDENSAASGSVLNSFGTLDFGPSTLDAVLAVLNARTFPKPAPLNTVPWFSAVFWSESSSDGINAVSKYVQSFNSQLEQLRSQQQLLAVGGALTNVTAALVSTLTDNAYKAGEVVAAEQKVKTMDAKEMLTSTDVGLAKARELQTTLMGPGGSLTNLQDSVVAFIQADGALQEKELQVRKIRAIANIVMASLSLGLTCITAASSMGSSTGTPPSGSPAPTGRFAKLKTKAYDKARAGLNRVANTAARAQKMLDNTKEKFGCVGGTYYSPATVPDASGAATESPKLCNGGADIASNVLNLRAFPDAGAYINPVSEAVSDVFGPSGDTLLQSVPVVNDVLSIANDATTLSNYDQDLSNIKAEIAKRNEAQASAFDQLRDTLAQLTQQAVVMTMTYIAACVWFFTGSSSNLSQMAVPTALLDPVYVWTNVRNNIVRLLVKDFELCPREGATNPYGRRGRGLEEDKQVAGVRSLGGSAVDGRARHVLERAQTHAGSGDFRRSVASKTNSKEETAAAKAAWDTMNSKCTVFFSDLEAFTGFAAEAQSSIVKAIERIRYKIVGNVARDAALSISDNFQRTLNTVVKPAAAQVANEAAALAVTRSVAYAHAQRVADSVTDVISQLCASWFYSNPGLAAQVDMSDFVPNLLKINGDCTVSQLAVLDPFKRVAALSEALSRGTSPSSSWRSDMLKHQASYAASASKGFPGQCNITQASFVDSLFGPSGTASLDVAPASFVNDDFNWCLQNAEVISFVVVFRDSTGKITPPPGSNAVTVIITSDTNNYYFKYAENGTSVIEYAFKAPVARRSSTTYLNPSPGADCGTALIKQPVGTGVEFVCVPAADKEVDNGNAFARLPPHGRWHISIGGKGWPAGAPRPASAEINLLNSATECVEKHTLSDIKPAHPGGDPTVTMGSWLCGGRDYKQRSLAAPPVAAALPVWAYAAVAGGALLIIAAAGVGVYLRRKKAHAASRGVGDNELATAS
jgi:hypothetical protein